MQNPAYEQVQARKVNRDTNNRCNAILAPPVRPHSASLCGTSRAWTAKRIQIARRKLHRFFCFALKIPKNELTQARLILCRLPPRANYRRASCPFDIVYFRPHFLCRETRHVDHTTSHQC
jgi:hypothetical protein